MRILLYAPSLTGHPQVYCRVIGDILLEAGHEIVIAAALNGTDGPVPRPYLRPFAGHPRAQVVNTPDRSAAGHPDLRAEELDRLAQDLGIDATLMLEADRFADEFRRIAAGAVPRLPGRTVGIFARTSGWHPREHDYGGAPLPPRGGTWRQKAAWTRRAVFRPRETDAWFFRTVLLKERAVDAVVVKDERTAARFGPPVHWMPEIYKVFGAENDMLSPADEQQWAGPVREFVARAGAANVALFFGTGAWYKGYDLFLRLADLDETVFALHAGAPERFEANKPMAWDTGGIRDRLRREGRLFETNAFVANGALMRLLFGSIERFVSTHRLTLSSSTVLQALDAGKPVLTPDGGLVGHRTRHNGLGMTYRYFDDRDLAEKWREFRRIPPERYAPAIASFMRRFSRAEVARTFLGLLTGDNT